MNPCKRASGTLITPSRREQVRSAARFSAAAMSAGSLQQCHIPPRPSTHSAQNWMRGTGHNVASHRDLRLPSRRLVPRRGTSRRPSPCRAPAVRIGRSADSPRRHPPGHPHARHGRRRSHQAARRLRGARPRIVILTTFDPATTSATSCASALVASCSRDVAGEWRAAAPSSAPALGARPIWRWEVALMSMSGRGDAKRLIPWWLMRQPEHPKYPVSDVGVTLTDRS